MPHYGRFDHTAAEPQEITAWYDTDVIEYPNLPDAADLIEVPDDVWAKRLPGPWAVQHGVLVPFIPPPPPPPSIEDQALARLYQPVLLQCQSMPTLNGSYAIDPASRLHMTTIAAGINGGMGVPGGGATFNYNDAGGVGHAWPPAQFKDFAQAVANYVYALGEVVSGRLPGLPSQTISIP
jgi:hypothetical protein